MGARSAVLGQGCSVWGPPSREAAQAFVEAQGSWEDTRTLVSAIAGGFFSLIFGSSGVQAWGLQLRGAGRQGRALLLRSLLGAPWPSRQPQGYLRAQASLVCHIYEEVHFSVTTGL